MKGKIIGIIILGFIISFVAYGMYSTNNSAEESKKADALEESKKIEEFVSFQIQKCLEENNQSEEICNSKLEEFTELAKLVRVGEKVEQNNESSQENNGEQTLPNNISQIIPSKMGNGYWQSDNEEVYYDHAEKLLEEYVLSYKGQDNEGLDLQDLMLVVLTEQCGFEVMLGKSNTEIWVSVSDELDDPNKLTVMMMTSSDVSCANTAYYFDVYLSSGKITAESDSFGSIGSAGLLDNLDEFD